MGNHKARKALLLTALIVAVGAGAAGAGYAFFSVQSNVTTVTVKGAKIDGYAKADAIFGAYKNQSKAVTYNTSSATFGDGGTAKISDGKLTFASAKAGDRVVLRVRATNLSNVRTQWKLSYESDVASADIKVYSDLGLHYDMTDHLYFDHAEAASDSPSEGNLGTYYVSIAIGSEAGDGAVSGSLSFGVDQVPANKIERKVSSAESFGAAIEGLKGMENQYYALTGDVTLGTKGGEGKELFFYPAEGKMTTVVIDGGGHTIRLAGDPSGDVKKGTGKTNPSGFGFHARESAIDGVNNENVTGSIGMTRIVLKNATIVNDKTTENGTYATENDVYVADSAYFDAPSLDVYSSTIDGGLLVLGDANFVGANFTYSDGLSGDPTYRYLAFAMGDASGAADLAFYYSTFTGREIDGSKYLAGMLYVGGSESAQMKLRLMLGNYFTGASSSSLLYSSDVALHGNVAVTTDGTNIFDTDNGVMAYNAGATYNGASMTIKQYYNS